MVVIALEKNRMMPISRGFDNPAASSAVAPARRFARDGRAQAPRVCSPPGVTKDMSTHKPVLGLFLIIALANSGCMTMECPPCPPAQTLPGKDFATPEHAFEYLQEAIIRGQTDDSFAWHEFQAFSEQMKKDKKVTREDYFFARKDVVRILRERIGPLESVRVVGEPEYLTPARDRAALNVQGSGQAARAIVVRETTYDIEFRNKETEPVYGVFAAPADAGEIKDGKLMMRFAIEDAMKANPNLSLDDLYEVKYSSAWKFYDIEGSNIPGEIERIMKDRPPTQPAPQTPEQPKM
jgi:hypothetical protein